MNLLQKLFKRKKKYQTVVLAKDLVKHMQETRTIPVPKYNDKNCKDLKISMFH